MTGSRPNALFYDATQFDLETDMKRLVLAAAFASVSLTALPSAASAQDEDYAVNQVYITEDEECPASTDDVITVCGVLEDPYRIPRALRYSEDPANTAWAQRVQQLQTVGETGINSCTPVGAGGATGCTQKLIEQAYADRRNSAEGRFGQLIAEERERRLSTIDEDAEETQRRVEQIEREYEERLERERAAPLPGEDTETGVTTGELGPPPSESTSDDN